VSDDHPCLIEEHHAPHDWTPLVADPDNPQVLHLFGESVRCPGVPSASADTRQPYFGVPWPSGVCDDGRQVPTPTDAQCFMCQTPIEEHHQGSFIHAATGLEPVHKECSLRSVLGGIGHLTDHSYWCTRMHDPDGAKTYRESALAVWAWVGTNTPFKDGL
jgi:hypothetical protein